MAKKKVSDLTNAEWVKVLNRNPALKEKVFDDAQEDANERVGELLEPIEGARWSIGYTQGDYLWVDEPEKFIEGLRKSQNMYGTLPASGEEELEEIEKMIAKRDALDSYGSAEYHQLDEELTKRTSKLGWDLVKVCQDEYSYYFDDKNLAEYASEMYDARDWGITDKTYVNPDFSLYTADSYPKTRYHLPSNATLNRRAKF